MKGTIPYTVKPSISGQPTWLLQPFAVAQHIIKSLVNEPAMSGHIWLDSWAAENGRFDTHAIQWNLAVYTLV